MADNIGTVYIPAPVVQLKDTQFLEDGVIVPQVLEVPCRNVHIDIGQYWAIPTKDNGIFTGWWYQPAATSTGAAIAKPTFDSFSVLRIRDKITDYTWWILATVTTYTGACNTCCGDDFTPIPNPDVPVIAPCQEICDAIDDDGNYFVVFAYPELGAGQEYQVTGSFDNVEVEIPNSTDPTDLQSNLNSDFTGVGDESPPISITWIVADGVITGTLQDGRGLGSSLCLSVVAVDS